MKRESTRHGVQRTSVSSVVKPVRDGWKPSFLGGLLFLCCGIMQADEAFFNDKVLPILAERCFECHSHEAGKAKGGLVLDSRTGWEVGGDSGASVVPGDVDGSLLIQAVTYEKADYEMPPKGKLPDAEVAILKRWVAMGAPDPRTGGEGVARAGIDIEAGRQFWSFRPVADPVVPSVSDEGWGVTESDRFVLARLEGAGLSAAPDADPERFVRRVSYDLTGLPPDEEIRKTYLREVAVDAQRAVERLVDRLLASPGFGEKWGRHWLDLARYADSNGSSFNPPFPMAWRYRNWVIDALNRDMPYDEFVTKQIAGDLLPWETQAERDENLIATGYLMLGSKVLGEFDKEQLTLDTVDEQVDVIGQSLMGLTLGCARCHDHKFDPVPQADYYALAGIFTSTVTLQDRLGGPKEDESDWSRRGLGKGGDERLQAFLGDNRYEWIKSGQKRYQARQKIAELERKLGREKEPEDREVLLKDLEKATADLETYSARLAELEALMPPYAEAVQDAREPADTELRIRGVPSSKGDPISRGFLQVASWEGQPEVNRAQSGRLELAQWITSPENPLTARVMANRVWHYLFGEGLVRTVDNFGVRGEEPTHPELLEHLARRLVDGEWKLKPLIREIAISRAYRMSTQHRTQPEAVDPENRLLWRQNRRRLAPEEIRDTLLELAGLLDKRPAENLLPGLPHKDLQGNDADALQVHDLRRTVYQPVIRTMERDEFQIFDFAPTAMTMGQRPKTVVAPQALYFLNAPFVADAAQRFAERIASRRAGVRTAPVVEAAFEQAVGRKPGTEEGRLLNAYLKAQFEGPPGPTVHDLGKLCQAIVGSTQFQFLD